MSCSWVELSRVGRSDHGLTPTVLLTFTQGTVSSMSKRFCICHGLSVCLSGSNIRQSCMYIFTIFWERRTFRAWNDGSDFGSIIYSGDDFLYTGLRNSVLSTLRCGLTIIITIVIYWCVAAKGWISWHPIKNKHTRKTVKCRLQIMSLVAKVTRYVKTRAHHTDEIPERDVTYHLTCLLIYHWTTTHLYSSIIFF